MFMLRTNYWDYVMLHEFITPEQLQMIRKWRELWYKLSLLLELAVKWLTRLISMNMSLNIARCQCCLHYDDDDLTIIPN